ncbi:MAG: LD-carboxypeptidase [Candidatus Woesearchaeota archaeon]|nr:LD-carboxypeptidase [Candidatus Woesearchaeota archaeon]MDP7181965.1 LD-carboxypeptidase [Candidatus Woesearchaeota archaeon]MDP7198983.1 LD-carboxypeptidase [Candidatus Woesearchaeota archaeon]MDP7467363.1 LD-carboxypeptidase [Candidatus Woesearchaeota archaeon]MDP7646583.1 LD-carboxypeptidase [Candidatus Woesearchaeota archaeon]
MQTGDKVAVISPSWGGPSIFPHIYELGLEALTSLGLDVVEFPTARAEADYLYRNPEVRAADVNNAFEDAEIKAIFAGIGGDDSVRILPFLDPKIIRNSPKVIMGYSDTATLLTYCNQLGLVTFNGPSVMAGFSQWNAIPEFRQHIKEFMFESHDEYVYPQHDRYTEGHPDWRKQENAGKVNPWKDGEDWQWLQGTSVVGGQLYGGCIEVLEFMKETEFWPSQEFWNGKILFLETSEEKPGPEQVKWMMRNYGMQGVYDRITGILVGRARDYSDAEKTQLYANLVDVVSVEFGRSDLPIVANMGFGHTDPQFVLPLGVKAEIDCAKRTLKLLESPFR